MKFLRGFLLIPFLQVFGSLSAQNEINLTDQNWNIWLDKEAEWKDDKLYLPPVDLTFLPDNPPTIGWETLAGSPPGEVIIPASIEEFYSSQLPEGRLRITDYSGVAWYYTYINIPRSWKKKRIHLEFEGVRMRAEVYINERLVGYDVIPGTPFEVDLSGKVVPGTLNFLAIRVTDPANEFSGDEGADNDWSKLCKTVPPGWGGIAGSVKLKATDDVYIENVYVRDRSNRSTIQVLVELNNAKPKLVSGNLRVSLLERDPVRIIASKERYIDNMYENWIISTVFSEEDFSSEEDEKLQYWSPENPYLYRVKVEWKGNDRSTATQSMLVGFRKYEVRTQNGRSGFFLNDEAVRIKAMEFSDEMDYNSISPSGDSLMKQLQAFKAQGYTLIRKSGGTYMSRLLENIDKLGLLYQEMPMRIRESEDNFIEKVQQERLLRLVKELRNHPSLCMYSLFEDSLISGGEDALRNMRYMHDLDPSRIITLTTTGSLIGDEKELTSDSLKCFYLLPDSDSIVHGDLLRQIFSNTK